MEILEAKTPNFEVITEKEFQAQELAKWGYDIIHRKSGFGVIPFGYVADPEDNKILHPDYQTLMLLEHALDSLDKGGSYREVSLWLSEKAGKTISHVGISKIWKRKRGDQASIRLEMDKAKAEAKRPKNRAEKKVKALNVKKGAEKRRITAAYKRLRALEGSAVEAEENLPVVAPYIVMEDYVEAEEQKVAFRPNAGPQTEFLAAPEKQVLYGGAAGGGKSYALLADFLRFADNRNHNGVILRRTNDELRDLKWKAKSLYPEVFPKAKYSEQSSTWTFPSGARLWMTFQDSDDDLTRFQGMEYTWVGFDELTHYPSPKPWDFLSSRLRSADPYMDQNTYMRATTNPGGPGHGWVKKMFIDPAPYNEAFYATDIETGKTLRYPDVYGPSHKLSGQPHPKAGQPLFERRFIPSSIFDNPYLADSSYVESLMALPEDQRRKLLDGDWSIAEGAAFSEFRTHLHVCKPFDIPSSWRKFRACDYGYSSFSCVLWFAIDPAYETLYVYRELYVSKHTGEALAPKVLELERGEQIAYGMLDSSCWHERGSTGPVVAEAMIAAGCRWRPADRGKGSRINGKNRLHELLKVRDFGDRQIPGIIFFDNCRQVISDLPMIPTDPDGGEDIDDRYQSDHSYDALRYGIMSRPKSTSLFDSMGSTNSWTPSDPRFGY